MKTLSQETAARVWNAHREIAAAKKLREETVEIIQERTPDPVQPWQRHLQLGIPSSENSHRILQLSPKLGLAIIDAHLANTERELAEASIAAAVELQESAGAPKT